MALIRCIECRKKFSDKAWACPKCACPSSARQIEEFLISIRSKPYEDRTMKEILYEAHYEMLAAENMTDEENARRAEEIWEEVEEMKEQLKKKWPRPLRIALVILLSLNVLLLSLVIAIT